RLEPLLAHVQAECLDRRRVRDVDFRQVRLRVGSGRVDMVLLHQRVVEHDSYAVADHLVHRTIDGIDARMVYLQLPSEPILHRLRSGMADVVSNAREETDLDPPAIRMERLPERIILDHAVGEHIRGEGAQILRGDGLAEVESVYETAGCIYAEGLLHLRLKLLSGHIANMPLQSKL